jgi:hypothetical protein
MVRDILIIWWFAVIDDLEVSELLEKYMEECGRSEQWITVYDFRTYFHLEEFTAPTISGFLRRLHHNTRFSCRYRVEKIEEVKVSIPQSRMIKRYLVRKRTTGRKIPRARLNE